MIIESCNERLPCVISFQKRTSCWSGWVKRGQRPLAEFGEKIMWLDRASEKRDRKWNVGIYFGLVPRSNEVYIGTPAGVVRAWSVKRLAGDERWDS